MAEVVNVSADLKWHTEQLHTYAELGFEEIYLHHVGQDLTPFVDAFGEHVLPEVTA